MGPPWSKARRIEEENVPSTSVDKDSPSADLRLATDLGAWNKISASSQIRRWGNQASGPAFAAPKPDPFLAASFEEVKRSGSSKKPYESAVSSMTHFGASAHASLAAASFVQSFLDMFPPIEAFWDMDAASYSEWQKALSPRFKSGVLNPLSESVKISAVGFNRSLQEARRLVTDLPSASRLKSSLAEYVPTATHFFGNRSEDFNASLTHSFMMDQLSRPSKSRETSSSTPWGFSKTKNFKAPNGKGKGSFQSSTRGGKSSSSSFRGNASGRSSKAGRK